MNILLILEDLADPDTCLLENGGCDHFCDEAEGGRRLNCSCADGYFLDVDGRSCVAKGGRTIWCIHMIDGKIVNISFSKNLLHILLVHTKVKDILICGFRVGSVRHGPRPAGGKQSKSARPSHSNRRGNRMPQRWMPLAGTLKLKGQFTPFL